MNNQMKKRIACAFICSGLGASSLAADLASCVALVENVAGGYQVFRSAGKPVFQWQWVRSGAPVDEAALSADGSRIALVRATPNGAFIEVVEKNTQVKSSVIQGDYAMTRPLRVEWVAKDRLMTKIEGHAAAEFQIWKATATGQPEPFVEEEPVLASHCTKIDSTDRLLCADGQSLSLGDAIVGELDLTEVGTQARLSEKSLRMELGQAIAIPRASIAAIALKEIQGAEAVFQLKVAESNRDERLKVGEWALVEFSDPAHLIRLRGIEGEAVVIDLLELQGGPIRFGPLTTLRPGTVLAVIENGPAGVPLVELWQQKGAAFVRQQRFALPRAAAVQQLRVDGSGVLVVQDEEGQYALSYSLTIDASGVPLAIHFAAIQALPSVVAGKPVLQWRCSR